MALPWHSCPKALHECAAKDMDQQCPQGPSDGTSAHGHHAHHKPGTAGTQTLSPFQAQRGHGSQNALGWEGQNQQAWWVFMNGAAHQGGGQEGFSETVGTRHFVT